MYNIFRVKVKAMSKKNRSKKKNKNDIHNDNSASNKAINNTEVIKNEGTADDLQEMVSDSPSQDTEFLDDDNNIDIGELHSLMEEIDDIKPYEERRARRSNTLIKEKQKVNINKRAVLLISILVLSIALFTALIVNVAVDRGTDESGKESQASEIELKRVTNKNIEKLVTDYIKAVETDDIEELEKLVDSMENVSLEKLKVESKYIEKYENIEMYFVKGLKENEYVIFASYDNKILNIKTLAPGAIMLYVIKDGDDYKIHTGFANDEKLVEYIKNLSKNDSIIEFNNNINKKLEEVCKTDKDLAAFMNELLPKEDNTANKDDSDKSEETTESQETEKNNKKDKN